MKIRKLLALLLTILLVAGMFAGCGAAAMDSDISNGSMAEAPEAAPDYNYGLSDSVGKVEESTAVTPQNQKLIRKIYLDAETEDMDALLSQVEKRINELGGYVEAREVYNGSMYSSTRYRNAYLTIRIPAQNLDSFVEHVSQVSNITSNRETSDDVTLQYVAIESRISALETERDRLMELLEQAQDMSDLLMIEARLTEVLAELESVNSQLRVYDNQINYGTIYLDVNEVVEYTEPEPENGWQRMGSGFVKSLKGLWTGIKEVFIFLVSALPYLALIAAIVVGVILIVRGSVKRKRRRNEAKKAEE